jgi:hypothetical protein
MSTLVFDPGDMGDYRRIFLEGDAPQLDERAFAELIVALKAQEILAPNLALLWRIPSIDGFDGGVLPLRRYLDFLTLLIPPDRLVPDGRLREQVTTIPHTGLLALLNGQYVITDKVRDLWFQDVYYDRQIGARLGAASLHSSLVSTPYPFPATHIGVIGTLDGLDEPARARLQQGSETVARLELQVEGASIQSWPITAGGAPGAHFADGALHSSMAAASGATVAYQDVEGERQEYWAGFALDEPLSEGELLLHWEPGAPDVLFQALTLIDARTGMFLPLLPSDRGRFQRVHSGDVKIYENLDLLPRAYLVHEVLPAVDAPAALALLQQGAVSPGVQAVVEGWDAAAAVGPAAAGDSATMVAYAPEEIVVDVRSAHPALLVISDAYYPGWQATLHLRAAGRRMQDDAGTPLPVYPTNHLFRGVPVPAGEHQVVLRFEPASWRQGLWLSLLGWALAGGVGLWYLVAGVARQRKSRVTGEL